MTQQVKSLEIADLDQSIGYRLRLASRRMRDITVPVLKANGLSPLELTKLLQRTSSWAASLRATTITPKAYRHTNSSMMHRSQLPALASSAETTLSERCTSLRQPIFF